MQTKKPDDFDSTNQFNSYDEFENYYFNKMDNKWELPYPTDSELDLIHSMAKKYIELLMNNEETSKDIDKNKMWQLLFKLGMLTSDNED